MIKKEEEKLSSHADDVIEGGDFAPKRMRVHALPWHVVRLSNNSMASFWHSDKRTYILSPCPSLLLNTTTDCLSIHMHLLLVTQQL